ncbi:PhnA domain-containing protein [Thiomicrorhabdus sediminis]|uniref:PhnA domain protein n=1 Tax=Thiomicrorhabdus sediminis TaxID=2580412 RepID=A0A4P9K7I0_9GAMM|nr:alkylphosphonate utilization protein [Thiomicrorhabdus sediminis]QCU90296.1 PhnA domain protein [Thiomicrorhabdus sediminis]
MSVEQDLIERSNNQCELCSATEALEVFAVEPSDGSAEQSILVCGNCRSQIENPETMDSNHWRCLNDSMWSPVAAVQVMSYRLLHQLRHEGWPMDLLDMMYLEDDTRKWAEAGISEEEERTPTLDSNGTALNEGDDVTLIKDLDVKGANFTAKRGTMVKNIHLTDNPLHIEGKVNGTQIVLVAAYLKKSN